MTGPAPLTGPAPRVEEASCAGSVPVEHVVVVVPVHDEEELLPRCVASLRAAVDELHREGLARAHVVLVLDACADGSAAVAGVSGFEVMEVDVRTVGLARSAGIERALASVAAWCAPAVPPLDRIWIANTDADSAVPPHWLTHQRRLAQEGAQVMIGTVRPDFADLDEARRRAWSATHVLGEANGHVHGANLGLRADVYRVAGGFPGLSEHEDVRLAARLAELPVTRVATDECWVLTSGRTEGRTPGGYARHLRDDLLGLPDPDAA